MQVKKLIEKLKLEDPEKEMRFYFLKDNILSGCQLETIIESDNKIELTIQDDDEWEDHPLVRE